MSYVQKLIYFTVSAVFLFVYCENSKPEGFEGTDEPEYNPTINPANFVVKVDNQFFPLKDSTTYIYKGVVTNDTEDIKVHVTNITKVIMGVTCIEVADSIKKKGRIAEATLDWYAQDKDGNVWYFGEDSKEYDTNGVMAGTGGSWEAGVKGAQPGIIMEAHPAVGDHYLQEYLKDVAEDQAEVLILDVNATVPAGTYDSCVVTKERTDLEPGIIAHKYYAPGVGCVLENYVKGQAGRVELVGITKE